MGPTLDWSQARRGLRLRTLVQLRWVRWRPEPRGPGGAFGFGIPLPLVLCFALIALTQREPVDIPLVAHPACRPVGATVQLGFDLVQLAALLWLTGGLSNLSPCC